MISTSPSMILAADVGGTNTKLALAQCDAPVCTIVKRSVRRSGDYATLEQVIEAFLAEPEVKPFASRVAAACFAVAGPVERGHAHLTNLTWHIDERVLEQHFSIPRVSVINDFAAAGLGIEQLAGHDLLTLQAGTPVADGNRIVIGAGTGLGVTWLSRQEGRYQVRASEGGHADFAPADALQDELLRYLRREFGHVSTERVLSGSGLARVLAFLNEVEPGSASAALLDEIAKGDAARAISAFALAKRDGLAVRALDLFVSVYGAFAGNMALVALAHGGVYVAGGIAPKIAAKMQDGTFVRAFSAKGRFQALLESIPVKVVMNEQAGLLGAVAEAARLARASGDRA